jgi:hypothetical protein
MSARARMPERERFWRMVDRSDPGSCWNWKGATPANRYGKFTLNSHPTVAKSAHRYAWEVTNGSIPEGRCSNRKACDLRLLRKLNKAKEAKS